MWRYLGGSLTWPNSLHIYLELVVCGVVQALDCGAVPVLADTFLGFLVQQQVLVMWKPGTYFLDNLSHGALFPPLGRNVAPVGTGPQGHPEGVIHQFEPATQPVRLGLILLQEDPLNEEDSAESHE